jgi:hypothetical protein
MSASPTAKKLAAKIGPILQQEARAIEPEIVARSGGPVVRLAVKTAYPIGVREVPYLTELGIDRILTLFSTMPIGDLARTIIEHADARKLPVDPTISAFRFS